jgi:SAM-dependent methyltransferase
MSAARFVAKQGALPTTAVALERRGLARHLTPAGLEQQFLLSEDPWHFATSAYERRRFALMLTLVQSVPHTRILEVGCAEGHFTQHLLRLGEVTAIDLSPTALARARRRAPGATYLCLRLEELPTAGPRYDAIVCGEVLYYVADLDAALTILERRGHYLVASNCYPSALRIDRALLRYQRLQRRLLVRPLELKAASLGVWELSPREEYPAAWPVPNPAR